MKAKKKLAPTEEIRRIKHWMVDLGACEIGSHHQPDDSWLAWAKVEKIAYYGNSGHTELSAWKDVERQVKKALEEEP